MILQSSKNRLKLNILQKKYFSNGYNGEWGSWVRTAVWRVIVYGKKTSQRITLNETRYPGIRQEFARWLMKAFLNLENSNLTARCEPEEWTRTVGQDIVDDSGSSGLPPCCSAPTTRLFCTQSVELVASWKLKCTKNSEELRFWIRHKNGEK